MKRISTFRYHSRGAGEHVGKVDAEEYTYRDREILDEDLQVSVILYEGLYGCQLGIIQEPKRLYKMVERKDDSEVRLRSSRVLFLSFSPLSHQTSNDSHPCFKLAKRGIIWCVGLVRELRQKEQQRNSGKERASGKEKSQFYNGGCNGELEVTLHLPVNVKSANLALAAAVLENCRMWPSVRFCLLAKANSAQPQISAFDGSEKPSPEPASK